MAKLNNIVKFLNKELNIRLIPDKSRNGLQVKTSKDIKKIGFAVDACISTFEKAKKAKVDLLVVHHGVKWTPQKYKKISKKRIDFLEKNKIALYAAHLPLDINEEYGNNIGLCRILNLKNVKKFGRYHRFKIGYKGKFKKNITINKIANNLNKKLKTKCNVLNFGKKQIRSIGIVSGGGSEAIEEAVKEKLDCFLVGEIDHGAHTRLKDYPLNAIIAGHYATETVGVKALMPVLKEKFNIETTFIDNPIRL
ncbi:Nif3-like dinuclear metal center hexameric protein [Candidatus Woesearchaeota archaeon]|nr:Nif3-like dinuclear metal center hexameric protein [Candidatus Woesearchaeota archaeon]